MRCPACDHENLPGADLCANCMLDLAGLDVAHWDVDPRDPLLLTPLGRLPLKRALELRAEDTVAAAIRRMGEAHEGCVFVLDDSARVIGVVTERDVVSRVAARGRDPQRTRLDEVMTWDPVTLQSSDPLAWALHRMGVDGYRHLAVVEEGRLVGFLSVRAVLRTLAGA